MKKFKKLISCLTAVMMLGSMAVIPYASAEETSTEICIYGTDKFTANIAGGTLPYKPQYHVNGGGVGFEKFNTGQILLVNSLTGEYPECGVILSYDFTVEESGYYNLEMSTNNLDNDWYSDYALAVDDGEFANLDYDENVLSSTEHAALEDGTQMNELQVYQTSLTYYLEAGEHTFKLQPFARKNSADIWAWFEYAKLTKSEEEKVDSVKINAHDEYTLTSSIKDNVKISKTAGEGNEAASTADSVKITTTEQIPDDGITLSYEFEVPSDGLYSMSLVANPLAPHTHISRYSVSIDSGEYTKYNMYVPAYTALSGILWDIAWPDTYKLDAGKHTFNFKITYDSGAAGGKAYAFFSSATLTKTAEADFGVQILGTDTFTRNYTQTDPYLPRDSKETPAGNPDHSNGKIVKFWSSDQATVDYPEEGIVASYPFKVDANGYYELKLSANTIGSYSNYAVAVDDGVFTKITSTKVDGVEDHASYTDMKIYDTTLQFNLSRGEHTFKFKPLPRSSGDLYCFFESADFKRIDVSECLDSVVYGTDTYELNSNGATNCGVYGVHAANECNNGKVVKITASNVPEGGIILKYPIRVNIDGTYSLSMSANRRDGATWVSPYAVAVDNSEFTEISGSTILNAQTHPDGGDYASQLRIMDTSCKYDLKAGDHTISFKITGERADGGVYSFLEWMKLTLEEEVSDFGFGKSSLDLRIGETHQLSLTATGNVTGDVYEYKNVMYGSDNDTVASVSEAGLITANGYGKAIITGTVIDGENIKNESVVVYVTTAGIYVENPIVYVGEQSIDGILPTGTTAVTAKTTIRNVAEQTENMTIITAVYDGNNAFVGCELNTYNYVWGEKTMQVTLDGLNTAEGCYAKTFVWDMNTLTPYN